MLKYIDLKKKYWHEQKKHNVKVKAAMKSKYLHSEMLKRIKTFLLPNFL